MARRFRLPEINATERFRFDLGRGQSFVLHHLEAEDRRWQEPVILCHGLAANRYNMDFGTDPGGSLARHLSHRGFDVWILETRGHGWARARADVDWSAHDEVEHEVAQAIEVVCQHAHSRRVLWVGHSWGGLLQLILQATSGPHHEKVAGFIAVGSPVGFPGRPTGVESLVASAAAPPVQLDLPLRSWAWWVLPLAPLGVRVARWFRPHLAHLSPRTTAQLLSSLVEDIPACILRQVVEWMRVGGVTDRDGRPLDWAGVSTPCLFIVGGQDWLAPPPAVEPAFAGARSPDKEMVVLSRAHGCHVDYGHGGLLLAETAPRDVFPRVAMWLMARASRYEFPREPSSGDDRDSNRPS